MTFTFERQRGIASNQFAVWVEDAYGQHVKTIAATRWTASGGWSRRPTSVPVWVSRSGLSNMSGGQADSFSGSTPRGTETLTFVWDGTDSYGAASPDGNYVIFIEGTLRWDNQVLFQVPITLGGGIVTAEAAYEFSGDSTAERSMITGVTVRALR